MERQNHGHATLVGLKSIARYPTQYIYHEVKITSDQQKPQNVAGWNHDVVGHKLLTDTVGRLVREMRPIIRDGATVQSIARVSARPEGGADFQGRDLAVAAGVAAIILPYVDRGLKGVFY